LAEERTKGSQETGRGDKKKLSTAMAGYSYIHRGGTRSHLEGVHGGRMRITKKQTSMGVTPLSGSGITNTAITSLRGRSRGRCKGQKHGMHVSKNGGGEGEGGSKGGSRQGAEKDIPVEWRY